MDITKVRISDDYNEQSEVLVQEVRYNDRVTLKVKVDFNPDGEPYAPTYMLYTPNQARQLATHLVEAANRADKGIL